MLKVQVVSTSVLDTGLDGKIGCEQMVDACREAGMLPTTTRERCRPADF